MKNELPKRIVSSIILIPLTFFFIIEGNLIFNLFLLLCFIISIFEWYKMTKNTKYLKYGLLFLSISFYSIYEIRNFEDGYPTYLISVLLICVLTDIGGYILGKIFKGPKLTKLSPNKTYSGMLGGYLFSITFIISINNIDMMSISNSLILNLSFVFLISSISQIGDVTVSYFKRLSNVKDTGKIIPGHGGLLDRIDGMIFAFPSSYIIYFLF